jgi:AraC-like DNA-binding protein
LHYKQEHEVQNYAARLFKVPKTLANYFGKYGSKSPRNIIHQRISLEAKRQLTYTDRSVEEIAESLGFEDARHFS